MPSPSVPPLANSTPVCQGKSKRRGSKHGMKSSAQEADAAIRKRLLRRPLILTAHTLDRLQTRNLAEEDVMHVLQHGAINRQLSTFGGQQLYALEGPGAPPDPKGSAKQPLAGSAPSLQLPERRLRILFAQNESVTVVVSAIDLKGP